MDEYVRYPYYCDDCCTWHLMLYGLDDDGQVQEGDTSGNWEPSDSKMPEQAELDQAWAAYLKWVGQHGVDPLNELIMAGRHEVEHVERWRFVVSRSIVGLIVVYGRKRGGKRKAARVLPTYVQEYMDLDPEHISPPKMQTFTQPEELIAAIAKEGKDTIKPNGKVPGQWVVYANITHKRAERYSQNEISRAARKALRAK